MRFVHLFVLFLPFGQGMVPDFEAWLQGLGQLVGGVVRLLKAQGRSAIPDSVCGLLKTH